MQYYMKLIGAVVGLGVLLGARYGLNLEKEAAFVTDILVTAGTLLWIYFAKNKPVTTEQRTEQREIIKEGVEADNS